MRITWNEKYGELIAIESCMTWKCTAYVYEDVCRYLKFTSILDLLHHFVLINSNCWLVLTTIEPTSATGSEKNERGEKAMKRENVCVCVWQTSDSIQTFNRWALNKVEKNGQPWQIKEHTVLASFTLSFFSFGFLHLSSMNGMKTIKALHA